MYYNSKERDSTDATGIYSPKNDIKKSAESCKEFLASTEIIPDTTFIGHVRKKTYGAKTAEEAHPFRFDNVVGVESVPI